MEELKAWLEISLQFASFYLALRGFFAGIVHSRWVEGAFWMAFAVWVRP